MKCTNPQCKYGKDGNCMNPKHYVCRAVKKPVEIHFVEWTGKNLLQVIRFTGQNASAMHYKWEEYEDLVARDGLKIFTLEGSHMASIGDMIIRGVQGEFYPCKPDIFKLTYDITLAHPD